MKENIALIKGKAFALKIVNLYKNLCDNKEADCNELTRILTATTKTLRPKVI